MCIRLALRHPERVEKMVLMAPGGLEARETYMEMPGIKAMVRATLGDGLTHESLRRVFERQLYDPSDIDDDVVAERLAIAQEQPQWVVQTMRIPTRRPICRGSPVLSSDFGASTTNSVRSAAP